MKRFEEMLPSGIFRRLDHLGIAVTDLELGTFGHGAMIAVHDDQAVTAFDWRGVAKTLPHE